MLPGLTDAQRSINFVRSVPGVACALVGMRDPSNVRENVALRRSPLVEPSIVAALQTALAE
jgi:aryl-alcohol dehydrogenase-like predicted oxidoreductase